MRINIIFTYIPEWIPFVPSPFFQSSNKEPWNPVTKSKYQDIKTSIPWKKTKIPWTIWKWEPTNVCPSQIEAHKVTVLTTQTSWIYIVQCQLSIRLQIVQWLGGSRNGILRIPMKVFPSFKVAYHLSSFTAIYKLDWNMCIKTYDKT